MAIVFNPFTGNFDFTGSSSGSSGLTVGTTTITSGTSGRVLYDNAGVVGEMTTTGSGTVVVLATDPVFPSSITVGAAGGATGTVLLKGTTSGTVTLSTADAAGTWTMKLPTTDGNSGEFLQTDGSGNTTWAAAGGGGSIGGTIAADQVAFGASADTIGGSDNFNWDDVALTLNATAATSQARLYWDTYPMYFVQQVGTKTPGYVGYVFSTTASDASGFFPMRSRGTAASPTEVQSGDTMGVVEPSGWDGSDFAVGSSFRLIATENYGASNHGTKGQLRLTSNGGSIQDTVYDFGQTTFAIPATSVTMPSAATLGAASGATGTLLFKGTTSGTVTLSTADAAGTWTMKLPTSAGSSGQFLQTDGSGNTTWAAGGGGITIGTTTITSGTNTRILYNNSGVVGEYTLTGSGTVVAMQTDPSLLNTVTLTRTAIGTTSADGVILTNTTAAAAGVQQYSPRLRLTGQGWKTDATAASQAVDWIIENQPVQGAANPTSKLVVLSQINGGGYSARATLDSSSTGGLLLTGNLKMTNGSTSRSVNAPNGLLLQDFTDGGSEVRMFCVQTSGASPAFYWESGGNTARMRSTNQIGWTSSASDASASLDAFFARGGAAATIQMGSDVNGAAVAQTLQACNGITGTDKTGADFTIQSGKGTGAGAASSLFLKTPTVGTTGTTAQTLTTRITLSGSGQTIHAPVGASTGVTLGGATQTATSGTYIVAQTTGTFNPSSTSTMVGVAGYINPTINYSAGTPGAGSYEALKIAAIETALPTGTNYLIRASAGATGFTDKFLVRNNGAIYTADTTLLHTIAALTNGAAAATGTLTNAPAAGNPTKWIPIDDNGTTRYIPAW